MSSARRLVVETTSIEEAREAFGKLLAPIALEQLDRKASFAWRSEQIALGPVSIAVQEYGAAFRASSEHAVDVFSMSFPLTHVSGRVTSGLVTLPIVRGDSTFVLAPPETTSFQLDTQYRGMQLLIRGSEMRITLSALLGVALREPLRFEPRLSLKDGIGASLERAVAFAVDEAGRDGGLLRTPLAASRFGEALIAHLLTGHAHNYSERLARIDRASDPRAVRVAADYLEANATKPIRMAELAAIAGVSLRSLQIGFRKYRGCTPAEFVRERRLDLARARLLAGGNGTSIAAIAEECGFEHLGRFSARYRARFAELPTETRAKAR